MNRSMKYFAVGDIHGRLEALKEVLKKSKFDYEKDHLIILGDVCDGGYNTYEVIEELLKIKNKTFILGNHDVWFINHIQNGRAEKIWLGQGGANTIKSYGGKSKQDHFTEEWVIINGIKIKKTHKDFFDSGVAFLVLNNMLFVHGGFNPKWEIQNHPLEYLTWDRTIIDKFKNGVKTKYKKVFIGHTTTQNVTGLHEKDRTTPICIQSPTTDLWMLDTGAGWDGKLTMMNVDTEEYWQSQMQEPAIR